MNEKKSRRAFTTREEVEKFYGKELLSKAARLRKLLEEGPDDLIKRRGLELCQDVEDRIKREQGRR